MPYYIEARKLPSGKWKRGEPIRSLREIKRLRRILRDSLWNIKEGLDETLGGTWELRNIHVKRDGSVEVVE